MKHYGEATSAASDIVEKEQQHIQELIKEHGYWLHDILHADESRLFYA